MPKIHIEGMGLMGCLIATAFERDGIDFTWNDTDEKVTAWKASTGCVFPTGEPSEIANYNEWINWLHCQNEFGSWMRTHMERGLWTYISFAPPHDGRKVGVLELTRLGHLAVSNMSTLHLNVPMFVAQTSEKFAGARADRRPDQELIVSHGYKRAVRYGWGWSCRASLKLSDELLAALQGARPCLYLRKGYLMYYAYPMPATDQFIVGTQNVSQKEPKERDTDTPYLKWLEHLEKTVGDHVWVRKLFDSTMQQGWRPYGEEGTKDVVRTKREPRTYFVKPQSGNGLRMFPGTYRALRKAMER